MLVSPGRNVRHADMQLLEHVTMATTTANSSNVSSTSEEPDSAITHIITGTWDPSETAFAVLNQARRDHKIDQLTKGDSVSVYVGICSIFYFTVLWEEIQLSQRRIINEL